MESAIAEHLQCPRSRHRRVEDDYTPPYPVWSARAAAGVGQVDEGLGYFREIASPRAEHCETMFSTPDRVEGVGVVMGAQRYEYINCHPRTGLMNGLAA